MTVVVPEPVPLEMPPGDPAALEDVAEDVGGTAHRLAFVAANLTSSSATAPHWHGADAVAASTQIAVVAGLADELAAGTSAAATRLRTHHRLLVHTRHRIATLREEQDEDFRHAWLRLSAIEDPRLAAMIDGPERVAAVEELGATEAARRREHARLLEELADDGVATAGVMADACRIVGGTGRVDGTGNAVAHLAAQLPGWGDRELLRRGGDLARALAGGPVHPREMNALSRDAVAVASTAAFARGLFTDLGVDGVRTLIAALGYGALGPSSPVARVLAAAFRAAVPDGRGRDPVQEVLTAVYVAPDDRSGDSDALAIGLAGLLLAGGAQGANAVQPATAATWARQLLERERSQGVPAGAGRVPVGWDPRALDPAQLALDVVAAAGQSAPAADLLADRAVWDVALVRLWRDGGEALRTVVALAGAEPGPAGYGAVRSGLEALGAGLSEKGDPADWTVRAENAAMLAPSLGGAVADQLGVATHLLQSAVAGGLSGTADDAVRGLGYLTLDRAAAEAIESALLDRIRVQPLPDVHGAPGSLLPAVQVAGAFFAVQEYGQRLAHAIQAFEAKAAAEGAETAWNRTVGLAAEFVKGPAGPLAGLAEGYLAIWVGADGTFRNEPDRGLRFDRESAAGLLRAELGDGHVAAGAGLGAVASQAYDRAAASLGSPEAPISPAPDYLEPLWDAAEGLVVDKVVEGTRSSADYVLGGDWLRDVAPN